MADLFCWWGQDLTILPNGDLLAVDGTKEGEQRVLRRLLTPPGSYIWHLGYGAGLPKYVGSTAQADEINALTQSQIRLEAAVASTPLPVVRTEKIANGLSTDIKYVDADTGKLVTLGFDVNP
jgi:hypothetical protein